MVQEKIPDTGGVAPDTGDEEVVDSVAASFTMSVEQLAALGLVSQRYRVRGRKQVLTEADFYAISTLEQVALVRGQLELIDHANDIAGRKRYGVCLFLLVIAWLFAVLLTVCATGITIRLPIWSVLKHVPLLTQFELSETVLITLIGSTTINVIGLLYVVIRYLFPSRDAKKPIETIQPPST